MAATINRRRRIVRCIVGVAVCLLGVLAGACGMPLVGAATLMVVGIVIVVGGERRIFRAGVTRTSDAVLCRYIPWLESGPYFLLIGLPLLGIGALCSGFVPGYPAWLRFDGGLLVAVALLCGVFTIRNWRVCFYRSQPRT